MRVLIAYYSQDNYILKMSLNKFGRSSRQEEKIQLIKELHRPTRKNYPRRRTIIKGLDDLWQADLAQLDQYARHNKGFKFILVVIDCFSKFVWCRPLKSKSAEDVTTAFTDILSEARKPRNLQTDQGKEFYNSRFQKLMRTFKINHYNTFSITKASMAERVIRTLKEWLYKYFSLNGKFKWVDYLPTLVAEYNNRKHRVIKMKPNQVNKTNERDLFENVYSHLKIFKGRKFKVGDIVRISKAKHVFSKGYLPGWSTELFKIIKVQNTNPPTYLLEDLNGRPIKGGFYREELQKTANPNIYLVEKVLRRKRGKLLVRWLGLDKSHDSWIDESNVL